MKKYTLEACVDSVESAQAAVNGGATRLELCAGLVIGGITPSISLYEEIRSRCNTKIHVLIRPRYGDFCYSEQESAVLEKEVNLYREAGAEGLVFGALKPDGSLDMERMRRWMDAAGTVPVTLHRAFDVCRDPREALQMAMQLGISTILTSGQKNTCLQGKELIRELSEKAAGQITILAAGGIEASVIKEIHSAAHINAFHMSGKVIADSLMQYRRADVHMGLPSMGEYEIWRTDENRIREAVLMLSSLPD